MVAVPGMWAPFRERERTRDHWQREGRIAVAGGYGSHGEPVRCVRRKSGKIAELWLSATRLVPEDKLAAEMAARYDQAAATRSRSRRARSRQTT